VARHRLVDRTATSAGSTSPTSTTVAVGKTVLLATRLDPAPADPRVAHLPRAEDVATAVGS
jgi:hypothetical protein